MVRNLNESTTSLLPNIISFLAWAKWLHSTKMWRTVRIHWQCSHWGGGSFFKMYEWVKCVWPLWVRHNNFILPAPPVGGLPISQDRLDRMKLVYNCTIPIFWLSGKNILVGVMFKISVLIKPASKEGGSLLFNDTLNTFYLQLYGVRHNI